jgi:putative transcriptional regulator
MKGSYLKGNIICALPQLKDIFFSKSIIYITHHNKDGAVGIVLNYKIMDIRGAELFKKLDIKDAQKKFEWNFHSI